jgi:hypothetical protein
MDSCKMTIEDWQKQAQEKWTEFQNTYKKSCEVWDRYLAIKMLSDEELNKYTGYKNIDSVTQESLINGKEEFLNDVSKINDQEALEQFCKHVEDIINSLKRGIDAATSLIQAVCNAK